MNKFSFCFNFSYYSDDNKKTDTSYAFTCENTKGSIQEYLIPLIPSIKMAELLFGSHRVLEESLNIKDLSSPQALVMSSFDIEKEKIQDTMVFWIKELRKIDSDIRFGRIYELSLPYNKDFLAIELELGKKELEIHVQVTPKTSNSIIYKV